MPDLPRLYWLLAFLRIALVLVPQTGYIHPDEFFQTTEILAHRMFQVDGNIPWEFSVKNPIRGMTLPIYTIGATFQLIKLDLNYREWLSPYLLLVGPRLTMCLLSFLVDVSLYLICVSNNERYKNRLVVLAASYIMYVYGTRTFSNTFEMICLAGLLYYVAEAMIYTNILLRKKEYLKYCEKTSKRNTDQFKFARMFTRLKSDELRNAFQIATIAVCGFFIRPTFVFYAMFPIFFWLYRGIGMKYQHASIFHLRIAGLIIYSVPSWLFNIVVDSFFYGYLTWGEIGVGEITLDNFVFTPWNFIMYNIDFNNLAKHGLHPRFLHVVVNIPLCFNILGVMGLGWTAWAITCIVRGKHNQLPTVRSIRGMMLMAFMAPLVSLSIFPHQEPRFLIPLILPLVYLHGNEIFPEKDKTLVVLEQMTSSTARTPVKQSKTWLYLWILINMITGVFFGFLHQRGVYPATAFIHEASKNDVSSMEYFVVSSFTYTIPKSLALMYSSKPTNGEPNDRLHIYELGSDMESLNAHVKETCSDLRRGYEKHKNVKFKFFLVIPAYVVRDIQIDDSKCRRKQLVKQIPLHVSTEVMGFIFDEYYIEALDLWEQLQHEDDAYMQFGTYVAYLILDLPNILALQIWELDYELTE